MGSDPLGYLTHIRQTYGDLAYLRMGREEVYVVSDPELIKEVLVTQAKNFTKGRDLERAKRLLGDGLITSEGAHHLRQRRMIQPAFHRERIEGFAAIMIDEAGRLMRDWHDGQEVDIDAEMKRLTLTIVTRTLFGLDSQDATVATRVNQALAEMMLPFNNLTEQLPPQKIQRMMASRQQLDAILFGMIEKRRASGLEGRDLLSMLLQAQDTEGDGGGMTNQQVRDEAMTIFLAGHETTSNALSWTWHLLGDHPEVSRRLREELDTVLAGRAPGFTDYPALPYSSRVVSESMRLRPPAWLVARRTIDAQPLGGYVLPPGAMVMMSQWVMHRDARYFPEPLKFDPDRWTPEFRAALPKYAYFPFGGGPRQCIGEGFAWTETVLLLAALAQRWEIEPLPGQTIVPEPLVTLRPKGGIRVRLRSRP